MGSVGEILHCIAFIAVHTFSDNASLICSATRLVFADSVLHTGKL